MSHEEAKARLGSVLDILDELANAIGTQVRRREPDLDYLFDHYGDALDEIADYMQALALEQLEKNAPKERPSDLTGPHSFLDHTRTQVEELGFPRIDGHVDYAT
jgi:ferredoxin-NADP reductase